MNSLVKFIITPLLEKEATQPKVVLFPGAFKPPTKGHFDAVNNLASDPNTKELIVIISASPRENIDAEKSKKIWDIFSKYLPSNVTVITSPSSSPVKTAYDLIKNNPDTQYSIAVGYRDENDEKDLARIKSASKYPNADSIVYKSSISSRATYARKELSLGNQEGFYENMPSILSQQDKEEIWKILSTPHIQESDRKGIKAFSREIITTNEAKSFLLENGWSLKDGLLSLTNFFIENGINVKPLPRVKFIENDIKNASNILGKTAYYDDQNQLIAVYTLNRHPIDIMKSFCHELWHHHQNVEGRLKGIHTTDTNEDSHLNDIEKETYLHSQILYRNWADKMRKLYHG